MSCIHPERSCRLRIAAVGGLLAGLVATAGPAGVLSWPGAVLAGYLVLTVVVLVGLRRPRRPPAPVPGAPRMARRGAGSRHAWR